MSAPGKQLVSDDSYSDNFFGSDSASSSSSDSGDSTNNFEFSEPFVLEIHDIKEGNALGYTKSSADVKNGNAKRLKKKKRKINATSGSTNTASGTVASQPSNTDTADEEFFDAHESLHSMPENMSNNDPKNAPAQVDNTQIPNTKSTSGAQNPQLVINPDALHPSPPPYKQSSFINPPDGKNPTVKEKASEPANPTMRKPSTPGLGAQRGITITPQTGNTQGVDPSAKEPAPGTQPVLKKPSALAGLKSPDPNQNQAPPPQTDAVKKGASGLVPPMAQSGQLPKMPADDALQQADATVKPSNPGSKLPEKETPK